MDIRKRYMQVLCGSLVAVVYCLFPSLVAAQDPYRVMDWKTEFTLRSYLVQEMHARYDSRRERLHTALSGPDEIKRYVDECREGYLNLLGNLPERTPLNAAVTGRLSFIEFSIEKVIIEPRPGNHLTANLYIPAGDGPFPAVLFFCGHEMTSKATASYQEAAKLFAMNGMAVMVVDPVSQGERVQFTDDDGNRLLRGSTTEHTLLNAGAILSGSSIVAWELWDNVRALDYLVSRPEIDSERIGCMGNSGGGAQTMYFIGYDERIKVAAPCSFITSREREYEMNGTGDGCQQMPFEGARGLEIADYLIIFAPKPLLILAGRYDFVDYKGTVDAYTELADVYDLLGYPERVSLFTFDDGHGLSLPKREAALAWFSKWLDPGTDYVVPGTTCPLDESETWCTPSGQVNSLFKDEAKVQDYIKRKVSESGRERLGFINGSDREAILDTLRSITSAGEDFAGTVSAESHGVMQIAGNDFKKIILRKEGEVPLPCLVFHHEARESIDTLIILLNHMGKASIANTNGQVGQQLASHNAVIAADLRGMGETAEKPQANDPKYYNSEYHNAVLSMHIGKPLPGQRIRDILMILDYCANDSILSGHPVKIIASGPAALPALLAAVLDKRITSLEMSATIRSFAEITDMPMEKEWFSYIIPGIMRYFDLPDLTALLPDLQIKYTENGGNENHLP